MTSDLIPIFTTHHSISESILTVEADIFQKKDKAKVDLNASPISCLALAKHYGQESLLVVESDISSYWKLYKNTKDLGLKLVYGVKLTVCADMHDKDPSSEKTESSVVILFKNSQAYYDMVPLYSIASTEGNRDGRRLDWKTLTERWSDNFVLYLPFYSSFVARNLMILDQKAFPAFGKLKPVFFVQDQGLPFDRMIRKGVEKYAQSEGFAIQPAHQVYYYKDADCVKHQTIQCINRRTTLDKPNLNHYGSDQFSYESYLRATGRTL